MALRHAPLLLTFAATASWAAAATPVSNPKPPEGAKCISQSDPARDCYQLLRAEVGADRTEIRRLEAQTAQLQRELRQHRQYPIRRSRQEMEEANRVFDSEFGSLRKTPGAFALASDLMVERMKDPRYATVPLDMIVRDVASRVARVASAGNEKLAAEAEAAKREAARAHEDAAREVKAAYDDAQRVVNAAQAIVQGSASDADTAAALAIINSSAARARPPGVPAAAPYVHCTSHRVGQGSYAHVETDCN